VRIAIDAQLDPSASPRERERRLEVAAKKIAYHQRRSVVSARSHRKTRRAELLALGIDPDRILRCPPWPEFVQLD
jgi:hypothetical protein